MSVQPNSGFSSALDFSGATIPTVEEGVETIQPTPNDIHSGSKYLRKVISVDNSGIATIDIYCLLESYDVRCAARQHAIKKLLCAGIRNKGSQLQDLKEARDAISRAIQLQEAREKGL